MTEAMPGKGVGLLFAAGLRLWFSSARTIFGGSRVALDLWVELDSEHRLQCLGYSLST